MLLYSGGMKLSALVCSALLMQKPPLPSILGACRAMPSYLSSRFGFASRRDLREMFRLLPGYGNSIVSMASP